MGITQNLLKMKLPLTLLALILVSSLAQADIWTCSAGVRSGQEVSNCYLVREARECTEDNLACQKLALRGQGERPRNLTTLPYEQSLSQRPLFLNVGLIFADVSGGGIQGILSHPQLVFIDRIINMYSEDYK